MKKRKLFVAMFGGLAASGAMAEDTTTLPEVVVRASKTAPLSAGAAANLGPSQIASRRASTSDTARMLADIPGVSLYGAGGVSSLPVIRGLADDRLRTKVDGMDLIAACPNHMNSPLSYIDPTAVERIQVYAGVTPVSLGGDSIGGSILVESAPTPFAEPGERLIAGQIGAFYRSNGNAWGGNVSATAATDSLSMTYAGSYAQSDNYRAGGDFKDYSFTGRAGHGLDEDEVGSTAYVATNQSLKVGWKDGGNQVDLTLSRQHIPFENYPNQRMDMTDNLSEQFNLAYKGALSWGTLTARAYYEHTQHLMDFGDDKRYWYGPGKPPLGAGGSAAVDGMPCSPLSGTTMVGGASVGCAAGMPMYTDGKNAGLSLSAELPLSAGGVLRLGAEYQRYRLDDWWTPSGAGMWPYTFWNIRDGQRDRYAAFGEWELSQNRWTHILGARVEAVDTDAGAVHGYNLNTAPRTGTGGMGNQTRDAVLFNTADRHQTDVNLDLSWISRLDLDDNQSYSIGVAQKTRSPNLYERYTWSTWQMAALMNNFVGDGNGYLGNPDLDPEVAHTISLTADWHDAARERWSLTLTPYYTRVQDYIDAVQWDGVTNAPRAVPQVDSFTVLKYVNQSAELYGLDLSAQYLMAQGTPVGDLTAKLAASYTRGKNLDSGDNLYNIMPLNAKLALEQKLGSWSNTLEGEFVDEKRHLSEVRNEMQTAGYGLANLRSRYDNRRWSLELGVENLFDRSYDLPLGGAYVGQGTTMTNPPVGNYPQWGTPVPGPGRSFYAAVNLKF